MRYRKTRRFRHRSNGRNHPHSNSGDQIRLRPNTFSNDGTRNNFKLPQSVERLVERYNSLAKEALSSGDKILSENYFQHADHFMRIVQERNLNQSQTKSQESSTSSSPDRISVESGEINHNQDIEKKKE